MGYQLEDDPIRYHERAISHHQHEISAMRDGKFRHFGPGEDGRLTDNTYSMMLIAERSLQVHQNALHILKPQA